MNRSISAAGRVQTSSSVSATTVGAVPARTRRAHRGCGASAWLAIGGGTVPPIAAATRHTWSGSVARLLPGIALSIAVSLAAAAGEYVQSRFVGHVWLESLVLAILLGTAVRSLFAPGPRFAPGITFSAKTVLEVAVLLLGAGISAGALLVNGLPLLLCVAAIVLLAVGLGFAIGRALGLSRHLALLVACGNAICGNSAIAAAAPVIGADAKDVAASIAFTAVLGVAVVLLLPALSVWLGMSATQFGVFAGMTVYAVPQVLAATAPVSQISVQTGTLIKLVRVLMLGPVLLLLSFIADAERGEADASTGKRARLGQLVPWFIVGFLLLMAARSMGCLPAAVLAPAHWLSNALTIVAMAALGLGVDIRSIARAGGRVIAAALLSLSLLACLSLGAIHLLHLA
ncbi:YeiH family protein [Chitinasiproducens palmae]|uniref:Conserved hypothetical integral membrane protein n=1 Tax=Chitinasiproducens palmae TaxID=1770053 RepID=A0A1H2PRW9_9BURK|nr:putative sulfate exporter family transporter [Chitinasiproducens palmae]SDV49679.1 conserved hypothetical integral membrane protein [Chitinasiproducens palmae]